MQELEAPDRRRIAYYPGVLTRSSATPISIPAENKTVHADFPLLLQHLYNVRGYLHGASTNEPVEILLMSANLNRLTLLDPVELEANGSFKFENVPSGRYTIFAAKENDDESLTFLSNGIEVEINKNIEGLKLDHFHKK